MTSIWSDDRWNLLSMWGDIRLLGTRNGGAGLGGRGGTAGFVGRTQGEAGAAGTAGHAGTAGGIATSGRALGNLNSNGKNYATGDQSASANGLNGGAGG